MVMERLTDCAQGYCEMYCKKYGHCFEDPGDCIFKDEIKMYDALKSIEGIVPFDRLLELADADRAGQLVVLPCKVGDDVWFIRKFGKEQCIKRAEVDCVNIDSRGNVFVSARRISGGYIGKTVFLTREEAEAAMAQKGGTYEDSGGL